MPAVIPFIPLIAAGIAGGTAVTAGVMQSRAANRATEAASVAAKDAAAIQNRSLDSAERAAREQLSYDRWLTAATGEARRPYLEQAFAALGSGGGGGFSPERYEPDTFDPASPFEAPSYESVTSDPGFKFRVEQGQKGLERSASAHGSLLTTGTLQDTLNYNQEMGSQEYDKQYDRAREGYTLNEALRGAAFDRNQSNRYNAASLNNQSAYQSASLATQGAQSRISSLLALAGLASPGTYPGFTDNKTGPFPTPSGPGTKAPSFTQPPYQFPEMPNDPADPTRRTGEYSDTPPMLTPEPRFDQGYTQTASANPREDEPVTLASMMKKRVYA